MPTWTLTIAGMTCASCVRHVDEALRPIPGIIALATNWQAGRSVVTASQEVSAEDFTCALASTSYRLIAAVATRAVVESDDQPSLVVIGSGGAAMAAALHAAEAGVAVTLIERGIMGGTCVNSGCVPSKTLIRAAEAVHRANTTPFDGIAVRGRMANFAAVAAQRDALVGSLRQAKYLDVLAAHPTITVLHGEARFTGPDRLAVNGRELHFSRCVVATGARPAMPNIPGLAAAKPLDSTSALALTELPRRLVVLGGRIIALELAQAFARLGVAVTIVQRSARIMPDLDEDVTEALTSYLRAEGITVLTGTTVQRVEAEADSSQIHLVSDGTAMTIATDRILVALGRRPNTEALAVEQAGVVLDDQGLITVDDHLQTSNPRVFAAGDVIGDPAFVYTAAYEGRLAAANALGASLMRDYRALPWVVFTDPQIAVVGLTEAEATRRGIAVDVAKIALAQVPRAIAARDTRGFLKLIKERDGDRLLGAVLLAPEAGDLIMEPTLAIRHSIGVSQLVEAFHPYLTQAEGIRLAAQLFTTDVSRLSCCA